MQRDMTAVESNPLIDLRREIDTIDDAIIALLARRLRISKRIGRIKSAYGVPVHDESREMEIMNGIDSRRLTTKLKNSIAAIYREIFKQSRSSQGSTGRSVDDASTCPRLGARASVPASTPARKRSGPEAGEACHAPSLSGSVANESEAPVVPV